MTHTITGLIDTRGEAEMAVEWSMQEHNLDRSHIRTYAASENSNSGTVVSGADATDAAAGKAPDGVRRNCIVVSADVESADLDACETRFGGVARQRSTKATPGPRPDGVVWILLLRPAASPATRVRPDGGTHRIWEGA